eukprot:Skav214183  [mRNA]  locus=scaffold945:621365:646234:- [translate_table: standard]
MHPLCDLGTVLLGDAAHCTGGVSGQGCSSAMKDGGCDHRDLTLAREAQLCLSLVPEVARLARRWDLSGLQEALAATVTAGSEGTGALTPEVVAGLFALGEPFGEQLGAAARSYVLGHFSSCAATEPFARWPQKDIWSGPDDAIYILDRDAERVVLLRSGEAEVVKGTIRLERPCGVAVEGPDRAVLDREGSRVVRYVRGRAVQVAGGTEPGSGAGELNAGPTGRIYAARWQLVPGVLAAGGCGPGDAMHQLREPVDVTVDGSGALIVADLGNGRVMRWAAPNAPGHELLQALKG